MHWQLLQQPPNSAGSALLSRFTAAWAGPHNLPLPSTSAYLVHDHDQTSDQRGRSTGQSRLVPAGKRGFPKREAMPSVRSCCRALLLLRRTAVRVPALPLVLTGTTCLLRIGERLAADTRRFDTTCRSKRTVIGRPLRSLASISSRRPVSPALSPRADGKAGPDAAV